MQDKEICIRIELAELFRELLDDIVRQDIERLVRNAEAAHLHACRLHLERLACADAMCNQRVTALQHTPNNILLMWPELNLFIHAIEYEV